ncbi:hypothetical protein AVEN_31299-1, partial [Araneus ventricosus]
MSEQKVPRSENNSLLSKRVVVGENVLSSENHQTPTAIWGRVFLTDRWLEW